MAAYTAELKDNNEDVVYPITTADSVVDSDNVSLQTRVNNGVFTGTGTIESDTPWIEATDIIWSTMVDKIYPVGSIYMSATLSTPEAVASALGGTWVAWGSGRVPVGVDTGDTDFDATEETGGVKRTRHAFYRPPINSASSQAANQAYLEYTMTRVNTYLQGGGSTSTVLNSIVASVAGGVPGDANVRTPTEAAFYQYEAPNLQPYITCYMYKRTA